MNINELMAACPNLELVVVGDKPAAAKAPRALAVMTPEQHRVLAQYARDDGAFRVNKDGAARLADAASAALRAADTVTELAAELASVTLDREKLRDNVAELVEALKASDEWIRTAKEIGCNLIAENTLRNNRAALAKSGGAV